MPGRAVERKSFEDRLSTLESDLEEAIQKEHYEEAARYRDQILELKKAKKAEETA